MIINGKNIADRILTDMRNKIVGRNFCVTAIIIGDDPSLVKFINLKQKAAEAVGVKFKCISLAKNASQNEIEKIIDDLNLDESVHGIFVELPLSKHLDTRKVLNKIYASKDIDLLSDTSKTNADENINGLMSPTVFAIDEILKEFNINLLNKSVAIFGMGELVGQPVAVWFRKNGCEVLEIDEFTKNPEILSRKADIIVSGVGQPGLITKDMVKEGVIIFDFGYGIKGDKIRGDVCDDVAEKASLMTPIPNGVGPLVIAAIFNNLLLLNEP